MNNKLTYFLASLLLCVGIFVWWIGGLPYLLSTGYVNLSGCFFILCVGVYHYILAFRRPNQAWIGADNCISLGLLGTVVGLIMAFGSHEVGASVEEVKHGIATALWTTGVGLVVSVVLYNLGYYLGLAEEETIQ